MVHLNVQYINKNMHSHIGRRNEAVQRGDHGGGVVDERGAPAVAAGGVVDLRRVPVRCRRLLPHRDPSEASQEARSISSLFLLIIPSQMRCSMWHVRQEKQLPLDFCGKHFIGFHNLVSALRIRLLFRDAHSGQMFSRDLEGTS
ncbi:unnamed protein product [Musa hybrid cultivar]